MLLGGVLQLELRETRRAHGDIAGARFGIVGYGSLGGEELGFGSDLDLVFLYDTSQAAAGEGGDVQSRPAPAQAGGARPLDRSEEHTSELQSLMRIPYAVCCLKKN